MATIESNSSDKLGAVGAAAPYAGAYFCLRGPHFAGPLSILAGLALWEFLSRLVVANALFLAAPTQIFGAFYRLAFSGQLELQFALRDSSFVIVNAITSLIWYVFVFI